MSFVSFFPGALGFTYAESDKMNRSK